MKGNRRTGFKLAIIGALLIAAIVTEIMLVFRVTSQQTKQSGSNKLAAVCGELEETIGEAKTTALRCAVEVSAIFDAGDKERKALSDYIHAKKAELLSSTDGVCFNAYVAGKGWYIIPDFNAPADYKVNERSWYTGAVRAKGEPYVTDPYVDAYSGNICYSVSVLLSDGETVVALDYTMENIQQHISSMSSSEGSGAVIVTEEGIIAGCSDEELVGKSLASEMPEYTAIFSLAKTSEGVATASTGGNNLFATRSGFGWYLIVSENNWTLYRTSYLQMLAMISISLMVFAVIVVMYIMSVRTARRAEEALAYKEEFLAQITGELQEPLRKIISGSSRENADDADQSTVLARINEAGHTLSERINKIISYSSIVRSEKESKKERTRTIRMSRHFRTVILAALMLVMGISVYINVSYTYRWGKNKMQQEVDSYEYQLLEWVNTQKSVLDMFSSLVSTNPDMLASYEETVSFLDRITKQYPEISVTYLANPELDPSVYMNNGWLPDSSWRVEERAWYRSTLNSEEGWSISAPYYDEQTGLYCITLSEKVCRSDNGEFLGIFGIDFYMDKLIDILGSSYSDDGYAFLADASGEIINHPYGSYQMSENGSTNILELSFYSKVNADKDDISFIRDYDEKLKTVIAVKESKTGFTVYVVQSIWTIYGDAVVYGVILIIVLFFCTVLVYKIMSNLIGLQEEANRSLKESADAAIAADRAKSTFLAQMSHEIRTPINAVLGLNEMILRESEDESITEYSAGIRSAGRTLLSLINSILDFSKIEDGKMEIVPAEYDTAVMISELVTAVQQRAEGKGLELVVHADPELPTALVGDDVRITQVISNLLTNAVKYTDRGTVTLTVKKESQSDDGKRMIMFVEVADTGIGIREEDIGGLFESFKRLDEKRNRNIEGTGLGISIVTKLLEMMNSKLEVASEYGKGSQFSFRLEQEVANSLPMGDLGEHRHAAESGENKKRLWAPEAKVLVVDDNDMNLRVAAGLVKINGIIPDTAASGSEALCKMAVKHYDIVFLDHMMPVMDGLEVMKQLREQNISTEGTAVIALTANAIVGAREMYLEAGFDDYLTKPIETAALEKRLERFLPPELVSYTEGKPKKQQPEPEPEPGDSDSFTMSDLEMLHEKLPQLNMMTASEYCMGSKEFFFETLGAYLESERSEEMEKALAEDNIKDYGIMAHSLKSSSLTIGAVLLSDHAREMEFAAKRGDKEYIVNRHEKLMEEFRELLGNIREVIDK